MGSVIFGDEITIGEQTYKIRKDIKGTNYNYYITIKCEDCGFELEKRLRVERPFIMKCNSCVNKHHPWNIGKTLTEEDRLHKSIAHGHTNNHTPEMNKLIGEKQIGKFIPEDQRQKMSISHIGKVATEEQKNRLSNTLKKNYLNPEYKDRVMKAARLGAHVRPTKPEQIMIAILNEICPNEYEYTGNGRAVFGGLCPDFLNINGQKKIVEIFGNYWHSEKISGKTREREESDRKQIFSEFGYETLIIWERELENDLLNDTIDKFIKFHNKEVASV